MVMESKEALKKLDLWVNSLSEKLIDLRFFEVEEVKIKLRSHFLFAIRELLQIQVKETDKKIFQAKLKLDNCQGYQQQKIQTELSILNKQKKEQELLKREAAMSINKDLRFKILHDVCFELYGKEKMIEIDSEVKKRIEEFSIQKEVPSV